MSSNTEIARKLLAEEEQRQKEIMKKILEDHGWTASERLIAEMLAIVEDYTEALEGAQ